VPVIALTGVDHDWKAQLGAQVGDHVFGEQVARFHLDGFER
jgi:hypothetical protein